MHISKITIHEVEIPIKNGTLRVVNYENYTTVEV